MARRLLYVLLVLVVVAAALAGGWYAAVRRAHTPYQGFAAAEQFVDIPAGSQSRAIGDRLVAAGVVRDRWTFRTALLLTREARLLKAGEYRFDQPLSAVDVVHRLARGEVYRRLITFREGLTIAEMAAHFEARGFGTAASFLEAATEASLVRAFDPVATDLEGYLFPETYALPRGTAARAVVRQMVEAFDRACPPALRAEAAAAGLTVRQLVSLAALVEKETARDEERPLVAAVYWNRLKAGMPMQADPTVIYALQQAGRWTGNITRADLGVESPYNTYRYPGLPPGPIAAPGRAALEAAARPADVPYLYFVSRNDGTHVFARTLAEHNRNVFEWQVQYFRAKRARERQRR